MEPARKKPVVVYGASGYTGRLVCEYLREYGITFIAAGRSREKIAAALQSHVPGIETADCEIAEVAHTAEALAALFQGASVVLNTVGPFTKLGFEVVQASLDARCHYLDTSSEQDWLITLDQEFGARFASAGLLLAPGVAQMYTTCEIAAQLCLETPGLDLLDIAVFLGGSPTIASTKTVLVQAAAGVKHAMPPRENPHIHRTLDSVHASGLLGHAHCVIRGSCNYKQTGLLQAFAAHWLLQIPPRRTGFASGCQAFGHRELLGALRSFGLVQAPQLSVHA